MKRKYAKQIFNLYFGRSDNSTTKSEWDYQPSGSSTRKVKDEDGTHDTNLKASFWMSRRGVRQCGVVICYAKA